MHYSGCHGCCLCVSVRVYVCVSGKLPLHHPVTRAVADDDEDGEELVPSQSQSVSSGVLLCLCGVLGIVGVCVCICVYVVWWCTWRERYYVPPPPPAVIPQVPRLWWC